MAYVFVVVTVALNWITLSTLALLLEWLLTRSGVIRGDAKGVVVGCLLVGVVMALADPGRGQLAFWLGLGALVPISINRMDLFSSISKGRWWWKKADKD